MELHFLGTGSAFPSPRRSSSCTVLRHEKGLWIFDCGEGSQIQIQKSTLKPGQIKKIFITHLHGDHLFGLPGLLCTVGMNNSLSEKQHVDIYGPLGLRNFIRSALMLSYSNLPYTFSVHELNIPSYKDFYLSETVSCDHRYWEELNDISRIELPLHPNEVKGTLIDPTLLGSFDVCYEDRLKVVAAPVTHTIPCVGYIIQEDDLPGKLDVDLLKGKGISPGPLFGKLKAGMTVRLDDGRVVKPEDCVGSSRKGRKIVILGDTYRSDKIENLAFEATVLVHESTNENADEEKAISHGHSSAGMAGSFALKVRAEKLIITHFSQRYRDSDSEQKEGVESVAKLFEEAKVSFQSDNVVAAKDLLVVPIPLPR